MKCPTCKKNEAVIHPLYGIVNCNECQQKPSSAGKSTEFTSESVREQRLEYKKDILQPFREGVLSREYLETYGTSGIEVTKKQVKNATYTNSHEKGWWNLHKTKGGRAGRPKVVPTD